MNKTDLAKFRLLITSALSDLDATLSAGAAATAVVNLDQQAIGRLSRQDALINQAMANAGQARRNTEKQRLLAALARIEDDEYGYCDDCGDEIPLKRLELGVGERRARLARLADGVEAGPVVVVGAGRGVGVGTAAAVGVICREEKKKLSDRV